MLGFGNKVPPANMVPPAEPLSGNGRNLWSSLRNLPTVASQRAAGEKFLPQNSHILSESVIFRVPLRFVGSNGSQAPRQVQVLGFFDMTPHKKSMHPVWAERIFLSVYVWKFLEIFPEICYR